MKTVIVIALLFLSGCATTGAPKDPCADRPVYKEYKIDMPERPTLKSSVKAESDGEVVRNVQEDMSVLIEYSTKLENLIKSLPKLSVPNGSN